MQASPPIKKVASRSSQHSKIFGQAASWQTVCNPSVETRDLNFVYSGPITALVFIHSGFRSIGVCALRASIRSNLRPSGAKLIGKPYLGRSKYAFQLLAAPQKY